MIALRTFFQLVTLASLAACASTPGDYPSLAQREAERVAGTFTPEAPPPAPPPPVMPSPDLAARLADLQARARALDGRFRQAAPAAERLASVAGATGSDSWASAQVALADLDSLRSQAAVSLAELDILWIDGTLEEGAPREAIGAARDAVLAIIAHQDEVLARLRGRL